jgi:pimeloyl-ACP methyl ester carboxylesterase
MIKQTQNIQIMKTFKVLLFIVAGLCLPMACEKSDDMINLDQSAENLKCGKGDDSSHGLDKDRYVIMKSTGLKVHYRVIGKGPIDIVFIPGWTNPLEVFSKQFDYFRHKARCIYIDVPGQGLSDAPEGIQYTMGMMADAIYDVIKKEGVKKFVGVGFSMGPVPLGQFELKHPGMITKLINLDGGFYPWPKEPEAREAYSAELDAFCDAIEMWGEDEKRFFGSLLLLESSPADLKAFVEYFYVFPSMLMANIYRNIMAEEVNQPIGWTIPILSIYSVPVTNMEYEQLYFPNAEIIVMENTGHVIQWEDPDFVNNKIWEFVADRHGRKP